MQKKTVVTSLDNGFAIRLSKYVPELAAMLPNDIPKKKASEIVSNLEKFQEHRSFETRLREYGEKIDVVPFNWGEPQGRELI